MVEEEKEELIHSFMYIYMTNNIGAFEVAVGYNFTSSVKAQSENSCHSNIIAFHAFCFLFFFSVDLS